MDNLKERLEIARLLARELAGSISGEERQRLKRWLAASPSRGQELEELARALRNGDRAWDAQRRGERMVDSRWASFRRQAMRKKRHRVTWYKYAAILLLPLLAGIYFLGEWQGSDQLTLACEIAITPGKMKAQLVMPDGQRVELERGSQWHTRDSGGTEIRTSGNVVKYTGVDTSSALPAETRRHTLIVPRGGEYALQLADGTMVWLNAGSTLNYPVSFKGETRRVEMTGEAYFEVARNEAMPFVVTVNGVDIRVLGTRFNVSAYRDDVITTLVEGKVRVKHGSDSVTLRPDQQAVWSGGESSFRVRDVEARDFMSWKEGIFYFDDVELGTILDDLARWYDVTLFYRNPALKSTRFTVQIKRYENIETILRRIEQTKRVRFDVKERTIIVHE